VGIESLSRRLRKIEGASTSAPALVWREQGETAETAEARFRAQHPKGAGRVLVVGWQEAQA